MTIAELEADLKALWKHLEISLGIIHENVQNVAQNGAGAAITSLPPIPVGTVTQATPAQIDAVAPVTITPAEAVAKSQSDIQNLGYVSYLNGLSQADRDAWVADYLTLATSVGVAGDVAVGAEVWNPVTEQTVAITDAAQSNLILLHNLGAHIVTGGTPNQ